METLSTPSLRSLRIFEAVARLESVSQASVEIHLSQPAVTQAIRNLELGLGTTLFERRHTGTYLTTFGEIFHKRTQRMFAQIEQALRDFRVGAENLHRFSPLAEMSRITRTQMRCFAAIAEGGSLTQVAHAGGISKTSLHRAVRELEGRLGKPLYRHTAHGITATSAGIELSRRMTIATRDIDCAQDEIKAASGALGGRISIGAQMLGSSFFVAEVANKFLRRYPEAHLQIVNDGYDILLDQLRTGRIDYVVGLSRNPVPMPDVLEDQLFVDPYMVVVRRGHPLTRLRRVTRVDLARFDWIVPIHGAARRHAFEKLFAGMSPLPKTSIETYSLSAIRAFLTESDRVTLLTKYEITFEERLGILTRVAFGPIEPPALLGVSTRVGWLPTPVQSGFFDMLRETAHTLQVKSAPKQRSHGDSTIPAAHA
ncbi:MAG: LysR family transcriptional regulator [Burkholderiales bacterium]